MPCPLSMPSRGPRGKIPRGEDGAAFGGARRSYTRYPVDSSSTFPNGPRFDIFRARPDWMPDDRSRPIRGGVMELVVGATGLVGGRATARLLERGRKVRAVVRGG